MAKQQKPGLEGAKAKMGEMRVRSGPRASTPKAGNADQGTSALQRAQSSYLKAETQRIEADLRREANRRKFSSRSDGEKRVRDDIKAGKVKPADRKKVVERRWSASKKRRQKFETSQKETRAQRQAELAETMRTRTPAEYGVQMVTANVMFRISDEDRETVLRFPAGSDTFRADAREALNNYMTTDNAHLLGATAELWEPLPDPNGGAE